MQPHPINTPMGIHQDTIHMSPRHSKRPFDDILLVMELSILNTNEPCIASFWRMSLVSQSTRRSVQTTVTYMLQVLDFDSRRGRFEFPRCKFSADKKRGMSLHYATCLLSFAEPIDKYQAAAYLSADASPQIISLVNKHVDNQLKDRAVLNMTLSKCAFSAVCPDIARVLPADWPLRALACLIKLIFRRPHLRKLDLTKYLSQLLQPQPITPDPPDQLHVCSLTQTTGQLHCTAIRVLCTVARWRKNAWHLEPQYLCLANTVVGETWAKECTAQLDSDQITNSRDRHFSR